MRRFIIATHLSVFMLTASAAAAAKPTGPPEQRATADPAAALYDAERARVKYAKGLRVERGLTISGALAMVAGATLTIVATYETWSDGIFPCGLDLQLFNETDPSGKDACERQRDRTVERANTMYAVGIPLLAGGAVMVTVGQTVNFGHKDPEFRKPRRSRSSGSSASQTPSFALGYKGTF